MGIDPTRRAGRETWEDLRRPGRVPPPPDFEPDTTIVADVVDLCLVAADRLDYGELEGTVEGDSTLAELVLANVGAFARG